MSTTTGKLTIGEIAMKHGSLGPIPADDPIYKQGWMIGATVPYKHRPTGSPPEESATPPSDEAMTDALDPNEIYTPDHPRYAEAVKQNPMLPLQNALEDALLAQSTEALAKRASASKGSTTPEPSDKS